MNTNEILQGIKNWTTGKLDTKADKSSTVSNVAYNTTNKKITKTINGTTSDVVTSEKVVEDGGGMNLVEGYYYNKKFYKEAAHTTEITGAGGRIYIDKDTNREYRFDGTKYVLLKSEVDGSFVNEGTFTYRPTAGALDVESSAVGEGGAQIECVKGNTIAWNQLVNSLHAAAAVFGITREIRGNALHFSGTSTSSAAFTGVDNVVAINTHKYYLSAKGIPNTCRISVISTLGVDSYVGTLSGNSFGIYIPNKVTIDADVYFACIDLTLIYGEGNEPTTAEQFEADYEKWFGKPLTYEEYDEGSIRSVEMTGIKTVGFNQYNQATSKANVVAGEEYQITGTYTSISENGATITPDAEGEFTPTTNEVTVVGGGNDTCIHLVHSGDRNGDYEPYWEHTSILPVTQLKGKLNGEGESVVIFPDGMKKAGTAYDEIVKRGNQTVAIKRISQVDLGDITSWRKRSEDSSAIYFDTGATSRKPSDAKGWSSYVCAQYSYVGALSDSDFRTKGDKSIANTLNQATCMIKIKDSAFDNYSVSEFKNAIRGIIVYYELDTPKEYIIDDIDFPTEYPVDDYGTEEILSDSANSLAPTLDIRYGLNATDTLRNLPSKYVSAVEEQNFTEAQKERARVNIGAASLSDVANMFASLPTSDPAVAGSLWNDGGVVKISVGTSNN